MTARSLRKKDSETVATLQSIREKDYTPFQIKTMRLDWLRRCELWLLRVKESKEGWCGGGSGASRILVRNRWMIYWGMMVNTECEGGKPRRWRKAGTRTVSATTR